MLSTDTPLLFRNQLINLLLVDLLPLFRYNIYMDIAISNVSIPHNYSLQLLPQILHQIHPLLHIKRKIIGVDFPQHPCCHRHVLSDSPDLVEFFLVARYY